MAEEAKRSFNFKAFFQKAGIPLIIFAFLVLTMVLGVINGISLPTMISDSIRRYGMWGLLVLAMVPSIQSGTGPNFALPVGICSGLLAEVCAIEFGLTGIGWLLGSAGLAIVFGGILGYIYGKLMNAVKGSEMTIATYTGFSITALFSLVWLTAPFTNKVMRWYMGTGLRETIQLNAVGGAQILNNWWGFWIGPQGSGIYIPTGMFIVFFFACFLVFLFFRSKAGIAISAGGINPMFAKAAGLNIDRSRVLANMLSTILGALGIIIYSQSFGYTQLYQGPMYMGFQAVAAILIGGATAQRSKVFHVILGAFLFQSILTTAPPVFNKIFAGTDLSEIMRMIIQNGVILYALTQVKGGNKG